MSKVKVFLPNKASKSHMRLLWLENISRGRKHDASLFAVKKGSDLYLLEGSHRARLVAETFSTITIVYVEHDDILDYEAILDNGNLVCISKNGNRIFTESELCHDFCLPVNDVFNSYVYNNKIKFDSLYVNAHKFSLTQ